MRPARLVPNNSTPVRPDRLVTFADQVKHAFVVKWTREGKLRNHSATP